MEPTLQGHSVGSSLRSLNLSCWSDI